MSASVPAIQPSREDVLAHLPISATTEYGKWQTIYGPQAPATRLYLVVSGKVALSRVTEAGPEVILDALRRSKKRR